jgi:hypothetical protein
MTRIEDNKVAEKQQYTQCYFADNSCITLESLTLAEKLFLQRLGCVGSLADFGISYAAMKASMLREMFSHTASFRWRQMGAFSSLLVFGLGGVLLSC